MVNWTYLGFGLLVRHKLFQYVSLGSGILWHHKPKSSITIISCNFISYIKNGWFSISSTFNDSISIKLSAAHTVIRHHQLVNRWHTFLLVKHSDNVFCHEHNHPWPSVMFWPQRSSHELWGGDKDKQHGRNTSVRRHRKQNGGCVL